MPEEWREIPATGGLYEASSLGRIRSKDRTITCASRWGGTRSYVKSGRVLKAWADANGYRVVYTCFDNERVAVNVHRLVARAFHGDGGSLCVNHRDGDKANNRPCNLEWVTHAENMAHARDTGLLNDCHPVLRLSADGSVLQFESINAAARALGKGKGSIQRALSGRYRKAYGFEWKEAA